MIKELPLQVGPYIVESKIGSGSFGDVYQGYDPVKAQRVALKIFNRNKFKKSSVLNIVEREIRLCECLSHKNIIKCKKVFYTKNFVVIAMECLSNGTINTMKEDSIFPPETSVYIKWCKDILEGLQYLHNKKIAHHDLKPENIGFDDFLNAKIIDLGFCEEFTDYCKAKRGTLLFTAPEIFWEDKYDGIKADIWSFGVTLHYLITGKLPFKDVTIYDHITNKNSIKENIVNECPSPFKKIVDMALNFDPKMRPTTKELLNLDVFDDLNKRNKYQSNDIRLATNSTQRRTTKNIIIRRKILIYSRKSQQV